MKIAMLTSDYLPSIGGIASHIHELSKVLIKLGYEIEIWYWDRKEENPDIGGVSDIPLRFLGAGKPKKSSLGTAWNSPHVYG